MQEKEKQNRVYKDKNLLFRGRREFPLQPLNLPI